MENWQEKVQTGEIVGRDPRQMSKGELQAVGHQPMAVIEALRLRCLDCCAGSAQEVRYCSARKCASWPFRMGTNPWRSERAPMSEEQKAKAREVLAKARAYRKIVVP